MVHVNALAAEEKERLTKEGRCFKCKKQGHISHKCPEREEKKDALCHGNQGMTAHAAVADNGGDTKDKVEELAGGITELGDDEREGLLDLLLEKGF